MKIQILPLKIVSFQPLTCLINLNLTKDEIEVNLVYFTLTASARINGSKYFVAIHVVTGTLVTGSIRIGSI